MVVGQVGQQNKLRPDLRTCREVHGDLECERVGREEVPWLVTACDEPIEFGQGFFVRIECAHGSPPG